MSYFRRHSIVFEEQSGIRRRHVNVAFEPEHFVNNKTLLVRLSDEEDLYFLYSTSISDEDFATIKSQQGLLVDFSGFSQKVIDLLELCSEEECSSAPKYTLKFIRSSDGRRTGVLQIIEATNFKYLTHLSLNLLAGDDETLKSYLVDQLKTLKSESKERIQCLEKSSSDLSIRLADAEQKCKDAVDELNRFKLASNTREENLKSDYEAKLLELNDKCSKIETFHRGLLQNEQKLSAKACEQLREDFRVKLEVLNRDNQDLRETRDRFQSMVKDLTAQVSTLDDEVKSVRERLTVVQSQLNSAEQICQTQSTTIARLECRVGALEQDLVSKEQLISKTQDALTSEQQQKSKLQEEAQSQTRQVEKFQVLLEKEKEEVKKANEIIKHLQTEVKSHHTKAKLRGQVAAEQERLLTAKETELQQRYDAVERLKGELKQASESVATLTEQLSQTSAELTEAQKTIKTNENIIGWLNRQISESQMGHMQQRLRSTCFPTPITTLGAIHSYSPPQTATVTNPGPSLNIPSPWQPIGSLNNPSSTIISRLVSVPCCSTTAALTSTVSTTATRSGLDGDGICSSKLVAYSKSDYSASTKPCDHVSMTKRLSGPGYSDVTKKTDVRITTLPAPVTKSTPLYSQYITKATNPTRYDHVAGCSSSRLPSYIPSAVAAKSRILTHPTDLGQLAHPGASVPLYLPGQSRPGSDSTPIEESDRTLHQQSLTSAYFPKPVGANSQQ